MKAWIDGRVVAPQDLPELEPGTVAPFETMGARGGELPLWDRHLARLQATAQRLGAPFAPFALPAMLRAAAAELLRANGHADDVLRLSLLPHGGALHTVLATRARGPHRTFVRLLPTVVERPANAPPADLKLMPRHFHHLVLQQAQDGGADDGIVIGADGALLETSRSNLWLRLAGTWVTPALDGRVLPGIARGLLLEAARRKGLRVAERACFLGDLHRAEALATSNAVHGPRAAALPGPNPATVAIVDSELGGLWNNPGPGFSR